jgi:cystathionine beta-lyase/cystathionine gamma-synthase
VTVRWVTCDLTAAESVLTERTKLLYVESPANPLNRLVPFERAVRFARTHNLISVIDATLAPPPLQYALKAGFDIELHSATKMLNGHSDLLAGVLVGRKELVAKLRTAHRVFGAVLDARAAAELQRGLQTLSLRANAISASALAVAQWLENQSSICKVHYPALPGHADYALAQQQMKGAGSIVAFDLANANENAARRFVEALRLVRHAPSLGGVESLISYPPLASHANWSEERLVAAGITRGTLRLSVGLEPVSEIIGDIEAGLEASSYS